MPNKTKEQELIERYQNMAKALKNNEKVTKEDKITVKEALTTADANIMIPKTIELVMLDAAEPEYLASQFLRNVNLNEGRSMEFINFGAIRAFEVGEGQELTLDSSLVA
jgi:nicotinate-nucleotide pyrophosphorylase